jgi:hypothetical protein
MHKGLANTPCDTEGMTKQPPATDEQRLERIAALRREHDAALSKAEDIRRQLLAEVHDVFPETRGEPSVRGRLTAVVKASGWTRAYVADIRDGKVKG